MLLGFLTFLGVQNAWAGNYLSGSMNSWAKSGGTEFTEGQATVFLECNTTYDFEVYDNGYGEKYWSNNGAGTITSTTVYGNGSDGTYNKQLYENGGHSHILTTIAGNYTFNLVWDNGTPYLTVTYPAGSSYTVAFSNPKGWTKVYAYVWNDESGDKRLLSAWPGNELSSPYTFTFESGVTPTKIIWNNGDNPGDENNTKTSSLDFFNNRVYDMSGEFSIGVTPNGYATFYAPCKVQLPSGVTAYTGAYNAETSTLTLNELTDNSSIIASTPVVLKRTSGSGAITFTATTEDAGTVVGTNDLHGSALEISTPDNSYVLGYQNSTTAFYAFKGLTIPANKAYLIVEGGAAHASDIRIIEGENNATDIYSVEANEIAVKFIENGKLFIRKNGIVYDATGCIVR